MLVNFEGQVPKDLKFAAEVEDRFRICLSTRRVALCDGASESFDSKLWADILAAKFVCDTAINEAWLAACIAQYSEHFDFNSFSWSKQASFARGSYATLIGVEISDDNQKIHVISIGDSLCALLQDRSLMVTFPYSNSEQFLQRPDSLSTIASHNSFITDTDFLECQRMSISLPTDSKHSLLCMTDALGEWALQDGDAERSRWSVLQSISKVSELEELVYTERAAKRMRVDDVTLINIDPLGAENDELPHP